MHQPQPNKRETVLQATNADLPVLVAKYPTIPEVADTP